MADEKPSYFVIKARESSVDVSFKQDASDELVVYTAFKGHPMPINVDPGTYICAYVGKDTKVKGHFKVAVKLNEVLPVTVPPYGP